jgi:SnoaL-like domain
MDTVFDTETLRLAIEGRDAKLLGKLYTEDAEIRIVDHKTPPSQPLVLRGQTEIGGYLEDVYNRSMTHTLEQTVIANNRLAFTEACQYPNGSRVLCAALAELEDGKIARQTSVQVWDG